MSQFRPPPPAIGRTIGGRYRLDAVLGRGGMAVVYAGVHVHTQRPVAVKVVPYQGTPDDFSRERLLLEARTAAALRHPHVVDVLDMGADEDLLFLVLERLEGRTLQVAMTASGPFSFERTMTWLVPIMQALQVLHRGGVIHRDVKPANIFLSESGGKVTPKLLDFGLARGKDDQRITNAGMVMGTPMYMAPEHAAGHAVGPGTDVWSLGVVLYECLAGRPPFAESDWASLASQITGGRALPFHVACPDMPRGVAAAIDRALVRDAGRRYRGMSELADGLVAAALDAEIALSPEALEAVAQMRSPLAAPTESHESSVAEVSPRGAMSSDASRAVATSRGKEALWLALTLVAVASSALLWQRFASSRRPQGAASPAMATDAVEPALPASAAAKPIEQDPDRGEKPRPPPERAASPGPVEAIAPTSVMPLAIEEAEPRPKPLRRRKKPVRRLPVRSASGVETEWL